MKAVIDASFIASLILPDEHNSKSQGLLLSVAPEGIAAPALWQIEVTNMLVMAERRKRITAATIGKLSQAIDDLPVVVEPPLTAKQRDDVLSLARRHDLTAYDSTYLELAMRLDSSLLSLDVKLRKAASACGILVH